VVHILATLTGSGTALECIGADGGDDGSEGYCYETIPVANVDLDVPGVLTFYGSYSYGYTTFGAATFTSLPEPVSGALALVGLAALGAAAKFRRKRR
jgi:hypothetical protein